MFGETPIVSIDTVGAFNTYLVTASVPVFDSLYNQLILNPSNIWIFSSLFTFFLIALSKHLQVQLTFT